MPRSAPRTARRHLARLAAALGLTLALSVTAGGTPTTWGAAPRAGGAAPARATNVVTPGDFTGYGFDQCLTPSQSAMDTWLTSSPFLAVGIYISGDSRACRNQPNLTPA